MFLREKAQWYVFRCFEDFARDNGVGVVNNGSEVNGCKYVRSYWSWGVGMSLMVGVYHFFCVFEVLGRLPGIVLDGVSFPFDQVLEFVTVHAGVDYLFDVVFFFSFNLDGQRRD